MIPPHTHTHTRGITILCFDDFFCVCIFPARTACLPRDEFYTSHCFHTYVDQPFLLSRDFLTWLRFSRVAKRVHFPRDSPHHVIRSFSHVTVYSITSHVVFFLSLFCSFLHVMFSVRYFQPIFTGTCEYLLDYCVCVCVFFSQSALRRRPERYENRGKPVMSAADPVFHTFW